ncbi:RNA 3'-terminal phosphate cyclase [Luteibacter aegosomatissinici]|uniref:RNA 3'-terminal phosphate cyclase n=1 Tax=Luteibacter aegosomatissinici TaxID=2911539 RepID=UPI001FF78798|nr:RNA 3'-terminal phosphate cyclase [Luteibacter aegosomatissinici]UPG94507.1 RNA 3'-terminal phosphate cyclase [Luteibacter aegosomatissinici]
MIEIDGQAGGGQLLRTALALSLCTGEPFAMEGIRGKRERPGLLRQHLTAVEAARDIGDAGVEGAQPGSTTLRFTPRGVRGGQHRWTIGTAGSTTLVLQTVLPALWMHGVTARLVIEGGTHNPQAPSANFIAEAFLPVLARMGLDATFNLDSHGFYPAGGGSIRIDLRESRRPAEVHLAERGNVIERHALAIVSAIPATIAERELAVARARLGLANGEWSVHEVRQASGPGNALSIRFATDHGAAVFTGFGEKRVTAEAVAERVCADAKAWMEAGVFADTYLADQLLLPMALAGRGSFTTLAPSEHTRSNAALIEKFLPVEFAFRDDGRGRWTVTVDR